VNFWTDTIATFGSIWMVLILLALAVIALEAERWWTRWRREHRHAAGAVAYALDALAIVSAVLAVLAVLTLLVRALLALLAFVGELLGWGVGALLASPVILAVLVAAIILVGLVTALVRGWLPMPRRTQPAPPVRPAGKQAGLFDRLASEEAATAIPPASDIAAPAAPVAPAQPREARAATQQATVPYVAAAPASFAPPRADEPVEGLPSLSMMGQRRVPTAAPAPQSFLTNVPVAEKRRSALPLVFVMLGVAALAGGAFMFRQQVLDLLPGLWPSTSYATSQMAQTALPTAAAAATPSPAVPTAPPVVSKRVAGDVLNLRAGPGTDQQVIATLQHGETVVLLDKTQTVAGRIWVRVRAGEREGWVSQEFLE
jgi:hypothetical protein